MASQRVKKSKISWGRMPPDPPRVERALLAPRKSFALSQHSPVTLTYSPATVILNENPAIKVKPSCSKSRSRDKFPSKGSFGQANQGFLDESVRRQVLDLQDCTLFLPFFHNYEDPSFYRSLGLVFVFQFFAAYFARDRRNHR